jgi:WD40 repeat protein
MRHRTFGPNALASDGMALFIGCDSGTVFRVPIVGPGELDLDAAVMLELSGSPILSLAVTHDRIFAGTYGGQVLRRSDTGELKQVMLGAPVPSLALHNGGLTAGTYGGEIVALDSELGIRSRRTAHAGSVKSLAAGPAGWLLSAATDRRVAASRTGQQRILWEHGNLVNSIAYADGYVVSASRDHTVKVASMRMDAEQCRLDEPPLTLLGPDESVKCVSLLGDGDQIVVLAGSYDFSLWAWRIPIGNARRAVDQLQAGVPLAQFDQAVSCLCRLDSETAVAASWDGTLQVIQLRSGVPVAVARHALRDALRPAEVRL